ncbi:MAG: hypothetical protein JWP78_2130 [Mucilaginibacter sp.]|nr:hypothetical protein [Mucilaginibacter sp.]
MHKTFTKYLLFLAIFTLLTLTGAFAQTITVGSVDPGPYGKGSTISVPITINDASGCIDQGNTFNLYLSDATGAFPAGGTLIGSYTGFYTPFVDGVIPNGTSAGAGYTVRVQTTSPATTSIASAAFRINSNPGVTASITSPTISAANPNVLVRCIGTANASFLITNTSAPGTTVTASFFNEQTQAFEGTNIPIPAGGYTFSAQTSNYKVIVKTVDASGTVGTHDYQLVNNLIRNNIGSTGNGFVCLANGQGDLSFNIDVSSITAGIQVNYPGNTYKLDWGDGTSTIFTFCQLKALNGLVTHTFTLPSCGQTGNGISNAFYVQNQAQSPYCGQVSAPPGVSAKVIKPPVTKFTAPGNACVGTALTIPNISDPGPDPNATTSTCTANPNAFYDWNFDNGAIVVTHVPLNQPFVIPANVTPGQHTLTLHSEMDPSGIGCPSADYTQPICFETPPQPIFSILSQVCITSGPVTPANTSIIDATPICGVDTYNWTVSGPGTVTYAGGTNASSKFPHFIFPQAGVYTVQLGINSVGCGLILAAAQTIRVDAAPTASLSPPAQICGNNLTFTFDPAQTITKTTFSGTAQTQPTTYTWAVSSLNNSSTYSFQGGTTPSSQYPKIHFDNFDTYTITVTHKNSCGQASDSQTIQFVQPPIVNAGTDQTLCASSPVVTLIGNISGGSYTSVKWTGGAGSFSPNNTSSTTYTPTIFDINAGQVTLTLQANTAAPCNTVTDNIVINFTPTPFITSPPTASACSGQPLNYTITANNPAATFTWTAALTSGTAIGFTASGSGNTINDAITNSGNTDAVVTYTIIPTVNSCPGNPFNLTVTIHPLPVITAVPVNTPICSNQPANIKLTSNVANTTYTWTSTASAGITGNINQVSATGAGSIQDILVNTGPAAGTVAYTITPYNGTCPGTPVIATITVDPRPVQANAGPDNELCNTTFYDLSGNDPSPGTGMWTGPAGVTFANATDHDTRVSGLIPGNSYRFQWTITGSPSCPPSSSTVNITIDQAPVGGTTSSPATVCSGGNNGQIFLAGHTGTVVRWESSIDNGTTWQPVTNTGTTQSYTNLTQTTEYRAILHNSNTCPDATSTSTTITVGLPPVQANAGQDNEVCSTTFYDLAGNDPSPGTGMWTGPPGVTFANATDHDTRVSGLQPGNRYQFKWTITGSPSCPPSSSTVNITIDQAPVGGTTSSPATVCSGGNNGQISLIGAVGSVARWESSVDHGATWQTIINTTTAQSYSNLTQTTQYRAIVKNTGICPEVPSTPAVITVNPQTPIADAGQNFNICNQTTITLNGNDPAPFSGVWTQTAGPAVTIANPTNYQTQVTGLSRGNVYTFKWTIKGLPPCSDTFAFITIGAYADVTASFTMDQNHGCGPTTVTFTNTSTPSPVGTFVWDFGDGSPAVTAINPPSHSFPPSPTGKEITYTVTLTPTSNCNLQTPYVDYVRVSPQKPIAKLLPNQTSACGTFTLVVKNLSPGNNAQYDFYLLDDHGTIIQHLRFTDTQDAVFQTIVPTAAVDYSVYVVATDQCGNQVSSTPITISVAPSSIVSLVQIKGDVKSVCLGSPVTFQNISSGGNRFTITVYDANKNPVLTLPAGTGDVNYTPTSIGTYYVSITAGNDGCGNAPVSALKEFSVYPVPQPNFTYTSDKDYNVVFNNTTPDAGNVPASSLTYKWDFGDGSAIETAYIPNTHRFDYSKSPFTITLTATTPGTNCLAVAQQTINVKFLGNVFVPNAFMPAGSNKDLKVFIAKGFGMKTWHMQIFNNFGQLVWETTKLDSNGSPVDGWDGYYKGILSQQGVYIWQISATLLNGQEWKGMSYKNSSPSRTGAIHLIR